MRSFKRRLETRQKKSRTFFVLFRSQVELTNGSNSNHNNNTTTKNSTMTSNNRHIFRALDTPNQYNHCAHILIRVMIQIIVGFVYFFVFGAFQFCSFARGVLLFSVRCVVAFLFFSCFSFAQLNRDSNLPSESLLPLLITSLLFEC